MYFGYFKNLRYDFSYGDKVFIDTVQDVLVRNSLYISEDEKNNLCFDYHVEDGERPEIVAHKFYEDPTLHWVILYINDIVNPYTEWYMGTQTFEKYLRSKYEIVTVNHLQKDELYQIHHWESNPHGFVVDSPLLRAQDIGKTVDELLSDPAAFDYIAGQVGTTSDGQLQVIPVTNYDYESSLNENKRFIKVIKPEYISDFVSRFTSELIR